MYLETTVVSYLVAWPSRDAITAARQRLTREWWHVSRENFELFVSEAVVREAEAGDPEMAERRIAALKGIPALESTDEVLRLGQAILRTGAIPLKAADDAIHIAMAAVHRVDFLLTWNVRHIANANTRRTVANVCLIHGYDLPAICNPGDLIGGDR
ncbi:MAG TPA: type II toxin-antitoxin system VapC family toxin [Longimicrobium sp.]|nr:type II toxin-antitoxin system VapC family toxin [Longimicrobium sp.]